MIYRIIRHFQDITYECIGSPYRWWKEVWRSSAPWKTKSLNSHLKVDLFISNKIVGFHSSFSSLPDGCCFCCHCQELVWSLLVLLQPLLSLLDTISLQLPVPFHIVELLALVILVPQCACGSKEQPLFFVCFSHFKVSVTKWGLFVQPTRRHVSMFYTAPSRFLGDAETSGL